MILSGEPYDDQGRDRKAFLEKIAKTCPNLNKRRAKLERRYRRSQNIRKVIAEVWDQ